MQMSLSVLALVAFAGSAKGVQFKDASVSVAENSGEVLLTLERTASSEAEDVEITAKPGTATASTRKYPCFDCDLCFLRKGGMERVRTCVSPFARNTFLLKV